ncbi:MAG TPA: hypothetical protein VMG39_04430 [Pseudolabrys sp.]|nr:hypothetical protein [Pseudolabrys sp.]
MLRIIAVIGLLPLLLLASPASALTRAQKMETCKFGADDQKLEGAKRNAFIKKCMAQGNFEPPGRKVSKKPAPKKPKKPAATAAPQQPAPPPPPAGNPPPKQ